MCKSCLEKTCLNARSKVMLEEHEGIDDDLEVQEQSADEDKDMTMWSVTHDEDWKYDYF